MRGGGPVVDVRDVAAVHAAVMEPGRFPFSHEGIWISALQPDCDDSRTASELGITARGLRATLEDTVRWLSDQGRLPAARTA